jgi:putative tricarboxylic transport membrane protein
MTNGGGSRGSRIGPALVGVCVIAAAGVIAAEAIRLSSVPVYGGGMGPAVFPWAIAIGLGLLGLGNLAAALRGRAAAAETVMLTPALWVVAGLAGQIILLPYAGFSVATGVLFGLTARGFGRGPLWLTIPVGVVLSFVVYLIFVKGLQLSLPGGPIENLV